MARVLVSMTEADEHYIIYDIDAGCQARSRRVEAALSNVSNWCLNAWWARGSRGGRPASPTSTCGTATTPGSVSRNRRSMLSLYAGHSAFHHQMRCVT